MRAFVTGGFGFAGRHLAGYLVSCGDDVALAYSPKEKPPDLSGDSTPGFLPLPKSVQSIALDITDRKSVDAVIGLLKPDFLYHLAAVTFVPDAENDYSKAFEINTLGTINLLDAVAKLSPETRFLYVSTGEVYGDPRPGSLPLTELSVLRPITAYGVSKAAADLAAFKYSFRENLHTVRVRPFGHVGPGQSDIFALSSFAKQVAQIKLGQTSNVIKVGNLESKRDYSDVSDIVRGYREVLLNGKRGEVYNLCSGQSTSIGELLNMLIKIAEVDAEIQVDPERVRPVEVPDFYGSSQKAQKELGWKPRIGIEGTLNSLFAYWVETLSKKKK